MRIAVVIPLHDKASTIVRALASVVDQVRQPDEIVVVDDGSTDGGAALVRARFPTVTVVQQENAGVGAARNAGVAATTAPWISLLDADDHWLPHHLHQLAGVIQRFPNAGMVAGRFAPAAPGAGVAAVVPGAAKRIDYFREAAVDSGIVHSSTVAVRRDTFERHGGFSSVPNGEDLELWARIALWEPVAVDTTTSAVYSIGTGVTERLRRAAVADGPPPVPDTIEEISPSAAVVAAALDEGGYLPPEASLRRYLDSRVAWAIRTRIALGDLDGARRLRRLLSSTGWPENRDAALVSVLPPPAIRAVMGAKRTVSSSIRWLRSARRASR